MGVAIIKYNAGNNFSVICALKRIGVEAIVTDNPLKIAEADKVIFPGVGEAASAMAYLRQHNLDRLIKSLHQPVLGICIGQQLMCRHSMEGDVDCLGIFDADVLRFAPEMSRLKVPHMGWNTFHVTHPGIITSDMENEYVYYVHSYYVPVNNATIATTEYINQFSASMHKDNFYSTQFHPEKSGGIGERILKNFLER
ncbi:imidazole glycerol phosphate synthase subunit HisH [uncultured Muribaculum sp.]|uniref:imidazole glycerol phosphate synthase subunit HisH n=1 Tax=uncultured Muribaculum sp. TaxID=1918613 RepID=UPI00272C8796|nr:imidazole glycerol phosphate synthase subunit HisH [uncultured Muribaculum sp.]